MAAKTKGKPVLKAPKYRGVIPHAEVLKAIKKVASRRRRHTSSARQETKVAGKTKGKRVPKLPPDSVLRAEIVKALKDAASLLEARIDELCKNGAIIVPITTFDPKPFEILKEIKVVVQSDKGGFLATFFDGGVKACGRNAWDCVENVKRAILRRFDYLDRLPAKKLGPYHAKQIAALRAFIRRRA